MRAIMFFLSVTLLGVSPAARAVESVATKESVTNEPSVAMEPPVTKDQALAAVAVLETNAASDAGIAASNEIIKFTQDSDAVAVRLNADTIPWANAKALEGKEAVRKILMAAYLGGNARAQLQAQTPVDSPYEGWLLTIRAYRQMQQKKPEITIPEVEVLIEKQAKGELKSYAAAIENKKPKP